MADADRSQKLQEQVNDCIAEDKPMRIEGGDSKVFMRRVIAGEKINTESHQGIVNYRPEELILTARAGTRLEDIETLLAESGQMLPFEPPHYGKRATLGGTIACGLSGPRRPYSGAARDFMLGARVINGKGEILSFGGEVMKNVAGYDVSRLMVGAYGTLGLLLDISLKVLPKPERESTLVFECNADEAIERMNQWAGQPLPVSATCHMQEHLYVRLSGSAKGVEAGIKQMGGTLWDTPDFWRQLKEQESDFFQQPKPQHTLWRISVPSTTPALPIMGESLIEWGGGLRWLWSEEPASNVRLAVSQVGGHASVFKQGNANNSNQTQTHQEVFHPLSAPLLQLHRQIKQAFDPLDLFNRGLLYLDL